MYIIQLPKLEVNTRQIAKSNAHQAHMLEWRYLKRASTHKSSFHKRVWCHFAGNVRLVSINHCMTNCRAKGVRIILRHHGVPSVWGSACQFWNLVWNYRVAITENVYHNSDQICTPVLVMKASLAAIVTYQQTFVHRHLVTTEERAI
jgi:hypothetical protein